MALYAKVRTWVIWLLWFYIRYGKEMPGKKAFWITLGAALMSIFAYEAIFGQFSQESGLLL